MLVAVDASLVRTAADSLLPIVQSQRERFRVRAQELETVCMSYTVPLLAFTVILVFVSFVRKLRKAV